MIRHARRSIFYLGATIVPRLLGILLLPVYSHFLSPQEYGIYGLSNTISQLLYMIMTFGMVSAVSRFYFDVVDEEQRRIIMGQIAIFLVFVPLIFLGILEWKGAWIFKFFTPEVSYSVYLRIVSWTAFFSMFAVVPLMIIRNQERSMLFALIIIGQAIIYHAMAIMFVVYFDYGVLGLLWSNLFSSLLLVPIYIYLIAPMIYIRISFLQIKELLKYSVPLIPHSIAGWILNLSDRIILQHWATLADIGVYSLGYTLGSSVQNVADAVNTSWFPSFYRSQATGVEVKQTLRMATYMLGIVCSTALLVAIGAHHFVAWFLPKNYSGAEDVVLWIAVSAVFILLYYIWSFSIHYSKRTWYLPIVTWSAAISNIGANVYLIPKFGYVAAAFSTLLSYIIMAGMSAFIAHKLHPVTYEYRRWFILVASTLIYAYIIYIRPDLSFRWDITYSLSILFSWPFTLGVFGFYSDSEFVVCKKLIRRLNRRYMRIASQ